MSMLQGLPKGEQTAPADPASKPSRMGWLTKWFGSKPDPAESAPFVLRNQYPPTMAYQPAPAPSGANNGGWGSPSPAQALAVTTPKPTATAVAPSRTPITSVQPYNGQPSVGNAMPEPAPAAANAKALREQGHAKDREGQLVAAENLYRQAIGADPTSAASVNDLGLCLARQGKLQPSIATLRQAIMMRPDKPLYRNNIATVLVEIGETDEALAHLKTAYGPAAAHHNLGQLLSRAGRTDAAIAQLNQALELEPTLGPAREALALLTAAQPPAAPIASPTPTPATPSYLSQAPVAPETPAPVPTPAGPQFGYALAQVASAPQRAEPTSEEPAGAPTFPRLLPPVLNR